MMLPCRCHIGGGGGGVCQILVLGLLAGPQQARAHGTLNLPESRNGGQAGLGLRQGGRTQPYSVAYWFTDLTHMVGNATIADDECSLLTCFQCLQNGCADTRLARHPWRAPGTAPLAGGPCGEIGWDGSVGRNASITRGTDLPDNFPYMPNATAPTWQRGAVESVAFGLAVNHGGGVSMISIVIVHVRLPASHKETVLYRTQYSYRLCPRSAEPTEVRALTRAMTLSAVCLPPLSDEIRPPPTPEHVNYICTQVCFQSHALDFVGTTTDIVGPHGASFRPLNGGRFD
jgi:hypothetical protein